MKAEVRFDRGGQYPAQTVAAATVRYDDGTMDGVVRTFKPGEGTNNTAEYQALMSGPDHGPRKRRHARSGFSRDSRSWSST